MRANSIFLLAALNELVGAAPAAALLLIPSAGLGWRAWLCLGGLLLLVYSFAVDIVQLLGTRRVAVRITT